MKKKFGIKSVVALMLAASALTCAIIGILMMRYLGIGTDMFSQVKTYIELRNYIDNLYIGEYDEKAVSDAALSAVVDALGDNWSYYMTPEEYKNYLNRSNNQYAGIGVSISRDEDLGGFVIISIFSGSPAEKAGIQIGETITAVNGVDITSMTASEAGALIGENVGESLSLTLIGTDGTQRDVTLDCEYIYTNPISYEMLGNDTGLITIKNFESGTADNFIDAVKKLMDDGAKSLVFDVRNNNGGKVSELTKMLDYLLPEGDIFVSVDKSGDETVTTSDKSCVELPMAVLVNRNSYSAAEFFAAALSEYGWAEMVGEHTTGKGTLSGHRGAFGRQRPAHLLKKIFDPGPHQPIRHRRTHPRRGD